MRTGAVWQTWVQGGNVVNARDGATVQDEAESVGRPSMSRHSRLGYLGAWLVP